MRSLTSFVLGCILLAGPLTAQPLSHLILDAGGIEAPLSYALESGQLGEWGIETLKVEDLQQADWAFGPLENVAAPQRRLGLTGPKLLLTLQVRESKRSTKQIGILASHLAWVESALPQEAEGSRTLQGEQPLSLNLVPCTNLKELKTLLTSAKLDGWLGPAHWSTLLVLKSAATPWSHELPTALSLNRKDGSCETLLRLLLHDLSAAEASKVVDYFARQLRERQQLPAREAASLAQATLNLWQGWDGNPVAAAGMQADPQFYRRAQHLIPGKPLAIQVSSGSAAAPDPVEPQLGD
jgi:hypothetical protein